MKTNLAFSGQFGGLVLAGLLVLHGSAATPPVPSNASLSIERSAGGASGLVTISNAADEVWVLKRSSNLVDWVELEALKIHNGHFRRAVTVTPTPRGYFRADYEPTRQNIASDLANALLLPAISFNYALPTLPPNFLVQPILGQDNMPSNNVTTDAGATLGRVLFYDKRLSTNQTISCSSCHQQQHGFSDPGRFSKGFDGGLTARNSMGLSNARWYQRRHFFWDERAATLEDQVLQPIQNSVEMGMTLIALTNRLAAEPFYAPLFTAAFGSSEITFDRISRALAQFVRSIISTSSKYDVGRGNNFVNFTAQENLGRQLFLGQVGNATCVACHGTDNFVPGPNINNNGLENPYVDKGLGGVTGRAQDEGLFKVPSLRNIALTAPYMHDGRFATLEEVVEFYNSGVVNHPNLSPPLRLQGGQPLRLNLTTTQKAALVAFLRTLTDPTMATNAKYSDPFNYGD